MVCSFGHALLVARIDSLIGGPLIRHAAMTIIVRWRTLALDEDQQRDRPAGLDLDARPNQDSSVTPPA